MMLSKMLLMSIELWNITRKMRKISFVQTFSNVKNVVRLQIKKNGELELEI